MSAATVTAKPGSSPAEVAAALERGAEEGRRALAARQAASAPTPIITPEPPSAPTVTIPGDGTAEEGYRPDCCGNML